MPVPDYQSIMLPLLEAFGEGRPLHVSDATERMADHFALTALERNETVPSGMRKIAHRVGWARTDLGKAGLVEQVSRGTWRITEVGRELLAANPAQLTRRYLSSRYPSHAAYAGLRIGAGDVSHPNRPVVPPISDSMSTPAPETPEEMIDRAHQILQASLADDLLERIKANSATFFEHLVIQLLLAMGYGGSIADAGQVLGRTGDGGIDGVINEDKLGLDSIYVQAKRWEGTVGRPVVQAFVGSLMGRPAASKGVLLTTGTFSQDAQQYVRGLTMRVILIDGPSLARLMIDHGVGVSVVSTYQIKRIDSDYFAEE